LQRGPSRLDKHPIRPRIADVAREAGVSKTAVSFAFNSPERLAPATAERIRAVAERLGYSPNPVARMLTQGETRTIGVLTPQALSVIFSNPFFAAFSEGVAFAAEASGYALHFISPMRGSLARALRRATVDGVVGIGLSGAHPEVEQIRRAGVPIVLVDSTALPEVGSIEVDDVGGARAAAEHLGGLGHRDVVIIGVEPPLPSGSMDPDGVTARRLRGYREGLAVAGVAVPDENCFVGSATIDGGRVALERAWDAGLRPTAILAMSDAMAIGAIHALRAKGLAIPADVSVVGFDDIVLAPHVDPPLTTVHQPIRRKGEEAVELLLAIIGPGDANRSTSATAGPEHRRLATELIVRASSGPVRGR
jgi:alanine racemase